MSALLDLAYSLLVGLVAIVGVVGVLLGTDDGGDGDAWVTWLAAAGASVLVAGLVWTLAVDPVL